jgi:hypothetical protein
MIVLRIVKLMEMEGSIVVARDWDRGHGSYCLMKDAETSERGWW